MHACLLYTDATTGTCQVTLLLTYGHERKPNYWSFSTFTSPFVCAVICPVALLNDGCICGTNKCARQILYYCCS